MLTNDDSFSNIAPAVEGAKEQEEDKQNRKKAESMNFKDVNIS